jgi:RNA polymerase sigma-70 factor (ECF subfamily)
MDLRELYDAHAQALFAFVLQLSRSEADTRDILQDLFCRLAREPGKSAPRNPRAYLLRCAYRLFVDLCRKRSLREDHSAESEPVFQEPESPDESQFREALEEALAQLPAEQRAVVHLKLWHGLTFDEIATVLELPSNTAASRYRYGLEKLRAQLRPLYEEIR